MDSRSLAAGARHVVAAVAALTLASLPGCAADPGARASAALAPASAPTPAPVITIESDSASWTEQIEWALARFERAGLKMPTVSISVHGHKEPCGGNGGLYRPLETPEVHLCSSSTPNSRAARLITLHELAHAWCENQLSDEQRASFLRFRGLTAWTDDRMPRHEWGAEHAAEVVSWGLMDEQIRIVRIEDADPAQLVPAFELLAHQSPLWDTQPR
jgi:hypothetical protein